MADITSVMRKDHEKIQELLDNVRETPDLDNLNMFRWEFEKHVFVEENAIFCLFKDSNEKNSEIMKILDDHEVLLKMLVTYENAISRSIRMGFDGFCQLLSEHKDYEDDIIYPRLDKNLTESEKKDIINNISKTKNIFEKKK